MPGSLEREKIADFSERNRCQPFSAKRPIFEAYMCDDLQSVSLDRSGKTLDFDIECLEENSEGSTVPTDESNPNISDTEMLENENCSTPPQEPLSPMSTPCQGRSSTSSYCPCTPQAPLRGRHSAQSYLSAIRRANCEEIHRLANAGVDVNTPIRAFIEQSTHAENREQIILPLLVASSIASPPVLEAVLEAGAEINSVNRKNQNALHILSLSPAPRNAGNCKRQCQSKLEHSNFQSAFEVFPKGCATPTNDPFLTPRPFIYSPSPNKWITGPSPAPLDRTHGMYARKRKRRRLDDSPLEIEGDKTATVQLHVSVEESDMLEKCQTPTSASGEENSPELFFRHKLVDSRHSKKSIFEEFGTDHYNCQQVTETVHPQTPQRLGRGVNPHTVSQTRTSTPERKRRTLDTCAMQPQIDPSTTPTPDKYYDILQKENGMDSVGQNFRAEEDLSMSAEVLLRHGINYELIDVSGMTPLQYAGKNGHFMIVEAVNREKWKREGSSDSYADFVGENDKPNSDATTHCSAAHGGENHSSPHLPSSFVVDFANQTHKINKSELTAKLKRNCVSNASGEMESDDDIEMTNALRGVCKKQHSKAVNKSNAKTDGIYGKRV